MNIKPIKTEADYNEALAITSKLMDAKPRTPQMDKLEVMALLIERYEDEHYPIDDPDPIDYLKFIMESRGMTRKDLGEYMGGRGRVSEILNRRRGLSLNMIRVLHEKLGLSADLLIGRA